MSGETKGQTTTARCKRLHIRCYVLCARKEPSPYLGLRRSVDYPPRKSVPDRSEQTFLLRQSYV